MPHAFGTHFRLIPPEDRGPDARGLSLDADGLVLGPQVKLIYPIGNGPTRTYAARSLAELNTLLYVAYAGPARPHRLWPQRRRRRPQPR